MNVSITESNEMQVLGDFLTDTIGVEVIQGLDNLVPEPSSLNFATMTPISQSRISTNVVEHIDCAFNGSILETTLTIEDAIMGEVVVGSQLFGTNVLYNTIIGEKINSYTYTVDKSQTVETEIMACGNKQELVPRLVTIQVDIHGPKSSENATIVEGLFRSSWANDYFKGKGFDIYPLYTSEPRQIVFNNAEMQNEKRWSIDCTMQVDPIISIPQQFADGSEVILVEVDTNYPA